MGKKHVSNISTHMHVHACTLHARISYASHNVFMLILHMLALNLVMTIVIMFLSQLGQATGS